MKKPPHKRAAALSYCCLLIADGLLGFFVEDVDAVHIDRHLDLVAGELAGPLVNQRNGHLLTDFRFQYRRLRGDGERGRVDSTHGNRYVGQ